jgi:hypothetical protein
MTRRTETPESLSLTTMRERIAALSEEEQARVAVTADYLRQFLAQDPYAPLAFALVCAEEAAK